MALVPFTILFLMFNSEHHRRLETIEKDWEELDKKTAYLKKKLEILVEMDYWKKKLDCTDRLDKMDAAESRPMKFLENIYKNEACQSCMKMLGDDKFQTADCQSCLSFVTTSYMFNSGSRLNSSLNNNQKKNPILKECTVE